MTAPDAATQAQIDAMATTHSTWLSANAGSGKTRVLTNRVALLLLGGTKPQNIVCLTYTKAAASEMQNRLFARLGEWAMLPNEELSKQLSELGVSTPLSADKLASARTLFALAIETPGGLRIQTIHSFCASILRRFPLEAGISPMFRELDDRGQREVQTEIVRNMAKGPAREIMERISAITSGLDYDAVLASISGLRDKFDPDVTQQDIRNWFGLSDIPAQAPAPDDLLTVSTQGLLEQWRHALLENGAKTSVANANRIQQLLHANPGSLKIETLFDLFLVKNKEGVWAPRKSGMIPPSMERDYPNAAERALQFSERLLTIRENANAEIAAQNTWVLHEFAGVFLKEYENTKRLQGWLDFDDQIAKAEALLTNRAVCDWVMFRLDGGIDHVLVDESQDTSPAQWQIIKLLAQDFGREQTGDRQRTIFVVGDKKQSIYSFQGADPDGFDYSRDHFATQLSDVGQDLQDRALRHSFRSAPAILEVVDAVFAQTVSGGFTGDPHISFHENMPGRVDIWHPLEKAQKPKRPPWYDLSDPPESVDADRVLADRIAENIKEMLDQSFLTTSKGETRRVQAGDILILVQRRKELFHHIIRACKAQNLPIAGADRLRLSEELAVKDLRAFLSFLALPQDSLSLATVLRSPLFGWSEKDLFDLAHFRKTEHLWDALQINQDQFPDTYPILKDLRDKADFTAPFDLLDRILTHHGGRLRMVARLGRECEEAIDELLNLARTYEAQHPASLTGFLAWLERDDSDIKRQTEAAGSRIRVMTTHGAKGLESSIVILPETHTPGENNNVFAVTDANDRPIWRQNKDAATDLQQAGAAKAKAKAEEERLRLLYVALTRAESWLIICGAGEAVSKPNTWYQRTYAAMEKLGATSLQSTFGEGIRYQTGNWPAEVPGDFATTDDEAASLDAWCLETIVQPPRPRPLLKPSEMDGAKSLGGPDDNAFAMVRGTAIHLLLEHTAWAQDADAYESACTLLEQHSIELPEDDLNASIRQAHSVLANPELAHLFKDDVLAEVAVTAPVQLEAQEQMYGIIDRLIVQPDRVEIVDFKSNAIVPETASATPVGVLQQLAIYSLAMSQIYPDRQITCSVLWTSTGELMPIPHNIVMGSLAAATAP